MKVHSTAKRWLPMKWLDEDVFASSDGNGFFPMASRKHFVARENIPAPRSHIVQGVCMYAHNMCELHITAEPLTQEAFAPFGTVISSPIPRDASRALPGDLTVIQPLYSRAPTPQYVNEGSGIQIGPLHLLENGYKSHAPSGVQAEPYCSFFSSFPREPCTAVQVDCLERHPYTKQTFVPIAIPAGASNSPQSTISSFLVVVAPTTTAIHEAIRVDDIHEKNSSSATNAPDLLHLKAFIAHGSQAISYNAGTWHAPMIVLGDIRVDFLVFQYANRVKKEDCEKIYFEAVAVKGLT